MSRGDVCFVCGKTMFELAETEVTVRRFEIDEMTELQRTWIWSGTICDSCLKKLFGWEAK